MTISAHITPPAVDAAADGAAALRAAFRDHPAGVGLITARGPEGPVGLTASSVASVGIDPPALSFSVTRAAGSAGVLISADTVLVHLLDQRHVELAQRFATPGTDRFTEQEGWSRLPTGEPWMPGAAALRCRALSVTPVGPSQVVIAEVLEVLASSGGAPLVYHDRAFRAVGEDRLLSSQE